MGDTDNHLRKFQKELSAGIVSLVLLGVLASARRPMYGYQIAKQLENTGEGVLSDKQSALYPVLRNLAVHDPSGQVAADRAEHFLALAESTLYAIRGNLQRASRDTPAGPVSA